MGEKFKRAVLFSGGGTRMMVYLGMFAALEEMDMKPDVLIASCGGAFAAAVINAFPDSISRKEYLKSEEYFRFVSGTVLTKHKKLSRIGLFSLKKLLDKRNAPYIEDVFGRYLVEMPQNLSEVFPTLKNAQFSKEISTLIIGSEILFGPKETGLQRNGRKLYRKVILTDPETAEKIDPEQVIIQSENLLNSAVEKLPAIKTNLSLLESARISVSDMFYVEPVLLQETYFAGGAIDLVPTELAQHLAEEIIIEKKQSYSPVEEAFVRSVLGFSGNERLSEIEKIPVNFQIDTTDIKQALKGHYLKKSINWGKFEIGFSFPKTYSQFAEDMEMQWQYGFNQTMKSIRR
ncbi:patatin-like phospholipase family protein [Chryseobacterium sp. MIQD13]|uniref:patatin-like phospholipase family protein n=1 Tax=Chryseobacterium sp. MIQD13 TaxID=3422310 RepID=UPI003D2D96B7